MAEEEIDADAGAEPVAAMTDDGVAAAADGDGSMEVDPAAPPPTGNSGAASEYFVCASSGGSADELGAVALRQRQRQRQRQRPRLLPASRGAKSPRLPQVRRARRP